MKKNNLLCAAGLILALSLCSCGKKQAGTVEDYNVDSTNDGENQSMDNTGQDTEYPGDTSDMDDYYPAEMSYDETWKETLNGGNDGFDTVKIDCGYNRFDKTPITVDIFDVPEFTNEYHKKICDSIFDQGKVEVYDHKNPTKKALQEKIDTYESILNYYDKASDTRKIMYYFPNKLISLNDEYTFQESLDKASKDAIVNKISDLKSSYEKAPETIENDYSYEGYLGKINNEDYYLYFGNRNLDEYVNSPRSYQINNRVITIMKKDLNYDLTGVALSDDNMNQNIFLNDAHEDINLKVDDIEKFDIKFNCINNFSHYSIGYTGLSISDHTVIPDDSNLNDYDKEMKLAEEFIGKLGYTDCYVESIEPICWSTPMSAALFLSRDYKFQPFDMKLYDETGGIKISYKIKAESSKYCSISETYNFDAFAESGDTYHFDNNIDVFIKGDEILGCQILNPITHKKSEGVKQLLDYEDVKDIVKNSVNDKSVWNTNGNDRDIVEIDRMQFAYFPIRSKDDPSEYSYIPCYVVYHDIDINIGGLAINKNYFYPTLIINALDGSYINVSEQLENYPMGASNGNKGYESLSKLQWEMFNKED
ncbi:hypothetical protein [Eubacterium ruminantium]|uniref:hypothetical protein n=1 Tax=Eubacterium ruminantium TaxID=42322 RepID=UPI001569CD27|nr:hypothetical protein [Eubacterium ruminantium]